MQNKWVDYAIFMKFWGFNVFFLKLEKTQSDQTDRTESCEPSNLTKTIHRSQSLSLS